MGHLMVATLLENVTCLRIAAEYCGFAVSRVKPGGMARMMTRSDHDLWSRCAIMCATTPAYLKNTGETRRASGSLPSTLSYRVP